MEKQKNGSLKQLTINQLEALEKLKAFVESGAKNYVPYTVISVSLV